MSNQNHETSSSFELVFDRAEDDRAVLVDDLTGEAVFSKKFLPKGLEAGAKVVVTIESEKDHAKRKNQSAREILNEILAQ